MLGHLGPKKLEHLSSLLEDMMEAFGTFP